MGSTDAIGNACVNGDKRQVVKWLDPRFFLQTAFNLWPSRAGRAGPRQRKGHRMIQSCCSTVTRQNNQARSYPSPYQNVVMLFASHPLSTAAGLKWEVLMRNADISAGGEGGVLMGRGRQEVKLQVEFMASLWMISHKRRGCKCH